MTDFRRHRTQRASPVQRLLGLLWPARCAACNKLVNEDESFCSACDISVLPLGPACPGCAMPADPARPCPGCCRKPFPFAGAQAALTYGGTLAQAILRFKHGAHRELARPLARYLTPLILGAARLGVDCVCPVPLHPSRLRQRGFNQTFELLRTARSFADSRHWPSMLCDVLERRLDTPLLGHGSPARRHQIVAYAFAVPDPSKVVGKRVLVVDDVMTTGATLSSCARTLLSAGATEVRVAALARAI